MPSRPRRLSPTCTRRSWERSRPVAYGCKDCNRKQRKTIQRAGWKRNAFPWLWADQVASERISDMQRLGELSVCLSAPQSAGVPSAAGACLIRPVGCPRVEGSVGWLLVVGCWLTLSFGRTALLLHIHVSLGTASWQNTEVLGPRGQSEAQSETSQLASHP